MSNNVSVTLPKSWDEMPLILTARDMAGLFGVRVSTIWRRCASQRMRPKPFSWQRPYVWYRDAVRAEFERGIPRAPEPRSFRRVGPPQPLNQDVRAVSAALSRDLGER